MGERLVVPGLIENQFLTMKRPWIERNPKQPENQSKEPQEDVVNSVKIGKIQDFRKNPLKSNGEITNP